MHAKEEITGKEGIQQFLKVSGDGATKIVAANSQARQNEIR